MSSPRPGWPPPPDPYPRPLLSLALGQADVYPVPDDCREDELSAATLQDGYCASAEDVLLVDTPPLLPGAPTAQPAAAAAELAELTLSLNGRMAAELRRDPIFIDRLRGVSGIDGGWRVRVYSSVTCLCRPVQVR